MPQCSEPIRAINCVQLGIHPFEKTVDLLAFPWPGILFQAADQVLLTREEHCYARHRRREFGMLVHWSEPRCCSIAATSNAIVGRSVCVRAEVGS